MQSKVKINSFDFGQVAWCKSQAILLSMHMNKNELVLFWFRRDLRLHDNVGLYKALRSGKEVLCLFIFDTTILDKLEAKDDARVTFIHQELQKIKDELEANGSTLVVKHGNPTEIWPELIEEFNPSAVFTNRDYEPYAQSRDKAVHTFLKTKDVEFIGAKDQVIFEKGEVAKDNGEPYSVYTPYMRKWKSLFTEKPQLPVPSEKELKHLYPISPAEMPTLADIGFKKSHIEFPSASADPSIVSNYEETRDIPSVKGTTRISMHLRFGTVGIRTLVKLGQAKSDKWLNELIWREFYQMILYFHPQTVDKAFKPKYDRVEWINDEDQFAAWCEGKTGYPIVDAGMRELNKTGFMHNRVRMITASFLVKHLLIDWRWGERYFAEKLLDFDLASNVGGWQWAASSGCDAAPYFRVFNPYSQQQKFDPDFKYIKRWVPEYGTSSYPDPIVDHKKARERVLAVYKEALSD